MCIFHCCVVILLCFTKPHFGPSFLSVRTKAITNVPIHTNGSAQMQYCAVVDEGNFVRLGRFHSTCTSAKIHLEAQEAIIMSKLGVISSVKYGCEISVSKFVNCESFHRVCSIRNIFLVKSMYAVSYTHLTLPTKA